ncbi:protein scylla-like [Planococcus citri]|uniref:protein scylla-like n=1 Tax=Planococcus citri TaxID=170843 RepID=UPI0031F9B902
MIRPSQFRRRRSENYYTEPSYSSCAKIDEKETETPNNTKTLNSSLLSVFFNRLCRLLLATIIPLKMMKEVGQFFNATATATDKNRPTARKDVNLNEVFNNLDVDHLSVLGNTPKNQRYKGAFNIFESIAESNPTDKGYLMREDTADLDSTACQALTRRLEEELRAAKSAQLACGEVLLPADLLPRIATDVLRMAEYEPCGLRGCTLFINFETETECRRIGTIKCDPNTVSTFELYLTLKQGSRNSWHSMLPQFLKNFTKGGTIMISRGFTLEKKKLYRSYLPE